MARFDPLCLAGVLGSVWNWGYENNPRGPRGRGGVATDKGSEVADFYGGPRKRWNQNRDGLALGWREGSALSRLCGA